MMRLWGQIRRSLLLIVGSPDRLYETFVRTGWSPAQARDQQAINLSVLETAPLFGVMLSLPVFAARQRGVGSPSEWPGRRQIDLLAVALTGLFLLIYLPRLPLHAQATVRYLHPIVPLLVYATARIPAIQNVIRERFRTLGWSYAAGVLLGGQLLIAALALLISSVGGAIQFQGLVNLAFAGGLAVWAVGAAFAFDDRRYLTLGSVLLGLALAAGTVTTLLLVWNHLAYGDPVLGIGHLIRVVVPP